MTYLDDKDNRVGDIGVAESAGDETNAMRGSSFPAASPIPVRRCARDQSAGSPLDFPMERDSPSPADSFDDFPEP
jgi:hypothetical protein